MSDKMTPVSDPRSPVVYEETANGTLETGSMYYGAKHHSVYLRCIESLGEIVTFNQWDNPEKGNERSIKMTGDGNIFGYTTQSKYHDLLEQHPVIRLDEETTKNILNTVKEVMVSGDVSREEMQGMDVLREALITAVIDGEISVQEVDDINDICAQVTASADKPASIRTK